MAMHGAPTGTVLSIVVVFSLLLLSGPIPMVVDAAIGCGTVVSSVGPCIPYSRSGAPPSAACCNGIRNLNRMASTGPDRRAACSCLKTFVRSIRGVNENHMAALPGKCRVSVPYPIRFSTDCSRVN